MQKQYNKCTVGVIVRCSSIYSTLPWYKSTHNEYLASFCVRDFGDGDNSDKYLLNGARLELIFCIQIAQVG